MISKEHKYFYLIQKYYQEQIESANEEYQLSGSTADPEAYYGRIEGQSSECDCLIDDYKQHRENKDVLSMLDLLISNNKINLEEDSKDYKLLYRELLSIKIDVCLKKVEMFETGRYTQNEYDKFLDIIEIEKPVGKGREERPSTYNKRVIINSIAKRIREKSPYVSKEIIAQDVANELSIKHSIKLSWKTVYRDYSDEL